MLNRFKNAVIGAVGGFEANGFTPNQDVHQKGSLSPKFPYTRPHFLELDHEQMQIAADHRLRPIIHPSQTLPFNTGYAECINAGKSKQNEDQAVVQQGVLTKLELVENSPPIKYDVPYTYYGLFDGHAGFGAALCAANQLHHIIHEKLVDVQDDIWQDFMKKPVTKPRDLLIIGALESGFKEMDQLIAEDRNKYLGAGGCTALVVLFILGRLYVANAGDSRAIICSGNKVIQVSMDFTPENERDRIRRLAEEQPALLGKEFTHREYICQPKSADLGKPIMYRDARMKGWAYKTLQTEDLKLPVITGQGKRSRVMGTIGVTRGFGDHDLLAVHQKTPIKPFLSSHPEVQVYKLMDVDEKDVLVMGTDGLWDVVSCTKAAEIIDKQFDLFSQKERYVSAATCLVGSARGILVNDHSWQLKNEKPASVDDISVFVVPLFPYKQAFLEFKEKYIDSGL